MKEIRVLSHIFNWSRLEVKSVLQMVRRWTLSDDEAEWLIASIGRDGVASNAVVGLLTRTLSAYLPLDVCVRMPDRARHSLLLLVGVLRLIGVFCGAPNPGLSHNSYAMFSRLCQPGSALRQVRMRDGDSRQQR